MKTQKLNKVIPENNQDEKPKEPKIKETEGDPKQFEEQRSINIRMKPQPYSGSKKAASEKDKNKKK